VTITAPASGACCVSVSGVAGAGRHVDDQVVELAPLDVGQELPDSPCTIGPRQITMSLRQTKKPIDINFSP
jgi:hypothetical protein